MAKFMRKRRSTTRRPKRKFNMTKPRRGISGNPMISVKRITYGGNWSFATTTTNDFWRYQIFDMSNFNNFAEFAAVFDEYKVNAIKVTYRPQYDSVQNFQGAGTLVQPQAYAHYVVDQASTVIPSGVYGSGTLQTFLENGNVKTKTLNKPFSIYYKPQVTDQVFNTGTASVMRRSPWVRTSDTSTVYRGYHMYLQQNNFSNTNTNIKLDLYITMYVSFRNLK